MSLWKFGNFEAEVDFTDADFLDVLEEAKAEMFEAGKKVPITGKQSDIIRAQCACFYVFFDTLFDAVLSAKDPLPCSLAKQGIEEQHQAV